MASTDIKEVKENCSEEVPPFAGLRKDIWHLCIYIYISRFLERVLGADLLELRMGACHGLPLCSSKIDTTHISFGMHVHIQILKILR